ncbi:PREDICTED: cytochrome c oxidase assembly protein COX11, mitochondrial isoform X2 [Tarenaya hassleriana]|uniref:cytochrome c oxidase assembly protein COX11, mitochondrial isoform X2 n=1 Tax=Tarenaya hassleriana TaxID=28532 RepID=UPI0008FD5339|nr:PREDICTED: cytochrome c oxidase assembly protein COX11, mitochondrial isoform X2 [Tarenaya hassleriana]
MSWSRPLRRTLLFSHLENLHHTSHPSRSVHRALCTSYCTHGAGRGDEHNFRRTISGLATRHGMRTGFWRSSSLLWPPNTDTVGRSFLLGMQRHYATQSPTETKSRKMLYYLTALVFGMVGLTYAAVPLYRTFCQATGYGGTVQRKESVEEKIARHADAGTVTQREIVVQFNADVADGMPWKFVPTQREVRVKPGESALAFYTAENRSSAPITGVSTYNVTPMKEFISTRYNAFASRSSVFFLENR